MEKLTAICPICHADKTDLLLKISQVPIHCNILFTSQEAAINTPRGDISLTSCKNCGHIFNADFQTERMDYEGEYENSLHFSPRFQAYAEQLAGDLVEKYDLKKKKLLEIGSGNGDFLKIMCQLGDNSGIGFDPSYVAGESESQNGNVQIIRDFFTDKYASLPADFIISRHVLEHIDKPAEFLDMLREIIAERLETIVFFEVPNAAWTIEELGIWDLIYEHFSYFTRHSLEYGFRQAGFVILNTKERFNRQFLTIEAQASLDDYYQTSSDDLQKINRITKQFAQQYYQTKIEWHQKLDQMAQDGETGIVWGAGSKGVTFMNVMKPADTILNVVDINPRKQGKFIAGTGQEIISPSMLKQVSPDVVIIMNANYFEEISKQMHDLSVSAQVVVA